MNFEQFSFDNRVLAGVKAAGYATPTPIQEQAIPEVMEGRDVLGLAQTGTGKTAAFMLPILHHLAKGPLRRVRALVIAPTRELAQQIHEATETLSQKMRVRSAPIYGGVGKGKQLDAIKRGTEIIVACPGRLIDHINEGVIDLSKIEVLVLDEADRMCDMGFLPDIRRILKHLPQKRQTLFFSATMPDDIRKLSRDILDDPVTVQIGLIAPAKTVSHALYPVTGKRKTKLLFAMLDQLAAGRILVFTRTKRGAKVLAARLDKIGHKAIALQGNMSQNRRQQAMEGFRKGKYDILVATDIAARGIDVAEITHVINFDIPDTADAYTHRIGRTGRAAETGEAFTFVTASDMPQVRQIERALKIKIERRQLEGFDYGPFDPMAEMVEEKRPSSNGSSRPQRQNRGRQNGRSQNSRNRRRRKRPSVH